MMSTLEQIFYGTTEGRIVHKWAHYLPIYERYLDQFRDKDINFLEIGVNYGGSLEMWRKWIGKQARFVGVDINPACSALSQEGFFVDIGDQGSSEFWRRFKSKHSLFDVIIDDGSHVPEHQILTFNEMFPHLKNGGIYICEDTHTNYLSSFKAGFRHPDSFLEYAKGMTDELNSWWSEDQAALYPTQLTRLCSSIHFHDSVVVFEKSIRTPPHDVVMGDISCAGKNGEPLPVNESNGIRSFYRPKIEEHSLPSPETYPPAGQTVIDYRRTCEQNLHRTTFDPERHFNQLQTKIDSLTKLLVDKDTEQRGIIANLRSLLSKVFSSGVIGNRAQH